ncbi:hypothetical protein Tco_0646793 [Tanacetum coccineum]
MSTLVEFMIVSGADNRPPILEKNLYNSWKSRMELYMQNREHGRMILESSCQRSIGKSSTTNASLPPEWSKFVTDVKLVRDLHTTNFDQLHAYLEQHELHANDVHSDLVVPVFKQGDYPIDAINKMMSLLYIVVSSRFPTTNNQLRNYSNLRQQATIHDEGVMFNSLGGVQKLIDVGTSGAGQCPKPKRKRDATWFKDKVILVKAQGSGKVLNEEELEFFADPGVAEGPITHTIITHNATYQADDLDAYDSDCDDFSIAKAVLMANMSSYRLDVLSEYLLETQNAAVHDTNFSAQNDAMILYVFKQLSNQVTKCNKVNKDNLIANESLSAELERYKERVKLLEERQNADLSTREKLIMDDIIQEKNA